MIARALLWVLEVGWAVAWALHFGAGWGQVALMVPAAIAAGVLRRRRPWAVGAWVLGAAAGAVAGPLWGAGLVLYAMWRGASPPDPDRPRVYERIEVALAGTAVLSLVDGALAWTMPAALAVGLVTTLEVHRDRETPRALQLRLAGALALVGTAAGLVVLAIVLFVPWSLALVLFRDIALVMLYLFSFISPLARPKSPFAKDQGHGHAKPKHPPHHPRIVPHLVLPPTWVFVALAAVALAVLAYRLIHTRWPSVSQVARDASEENLERDPFHLRRSGQAARGGSVLTRRVVQGRMRWGRRRRVGPLRHETVREWIERVYGAPAAALASLYEEVRYGGVADDSRRARALQTRWPADPEPPNDKPTTTRTPHS